MNQNPVLQQTLNRISEQLCISASFIEASDHPYDCKCEKCLAWWVEVGPEDTADGWSFGPFTQEEYIAAGGIVPPSLPNSELDDDAEAEVFVLQGVIDALLLDENLGEDDKLSA